MIDEPCCGGRRVLGRFCGCGSGFGDRIGRLQWSRGARNCETESSLLEGGGHGVGRKEQILFLGRGRVGESWR